jgi:hypothetical protein
MRCPKVRWLVPYEALKSGGLLTCDSAHLGRDLPFLPVGRPVRRSLGFA